MSALHKEHIGVGDVVEARHREWVVVAKPSSHQLTLCALGGAHENILKIHTGLELSEVKKSRLRLPTTAFRLSTQVKAALYAQSLCLNIRQGVGPFRCAAQLTFEPHSYQWVPLLMALRLEVPRLIIADDVGVGKTIEAGLILREFMSRGEVSAFSVLCPPHLLEQWERELQLRFGIQAVVVSSKSISELEQCLPIDQPLFEAFPYTIISLDYIKTSKRRKNFASYSPDFIIVDEAHTCVGAFRGQQQRHRLLTELAKRPEMRIIMLTATPYAGGEKAFGRLLSLVSEDFASLDFKDAAYQRKLARHYVQRRRMDVVLAGEDKHHTFAHHESAEWCYGLSEAHQSFQNNVLDYCLEHIAQSTAKETKKRFSLWGFLALMRCVSSSPRSALQALEGRKGSMLRVISDTDEMQEREIDVSCGIELSPLIHEAQSLMAPERDSKLRALMAILKQELLAEGFYPVIFCGFVHTVHYLAEQLKAEFPEAIIEGVTGELSSEERRQRVMSMGAQKHSRILVTTDCLSEVIQLQQLFNAVIHYDLSWNPKRHQQRVRRLDRLGQVSRRVRSVMLYSLHSHMDRALLDVLLGKAQETAKATGVNAPIPLEEEDAVSDALYASLKLRHSKQKSLLREEFESKFSRIKSQKPLSHGVIHDEGNPLVLDLAERMDDTEKIEILNLQWRSALEHDKKSRKIFAQSSIKTEEAMNNALTKVRDHLCDHKEVESFLERALFLAGVPLERADSEALVHVHALGPELRKRLHYKGIQDTVRFCFKGPASFGASLTHRSHPLIKALAGIFTCPTLDPKRFPQLAISPIGAWFSEEISVTTTIILLRFRFKLMSSGRKSSMVVAEEAASLAFQEGELWLAGREVRKLLSKPAAGHMPHAKQRKLVNAACQDLSKVYRGPILEHLNFCAQKLAEDHKSVRNARVGSRAMKIETCPSIDIAGLFVLSARSDCEG